jgi:hypothetical protein
MFYYILKISNRYGRSELPNDYIGSSEVLICWVDRKGVMPWIGTFHVKRLEEG